MDIAGDESIPDSDSNSRESVVTEAQPVVTTADVEKTTDPIESAREELLQNKASEIVNSVVERSLSQLHSSGDYSMLSDAEQFKVSDKEEISVADKKDVEEKSDEEIKPNEEKNEWMDVLGNNLLKKKVLSPGEGPKTRPKKGQEVTIIVETLLVDRTVFEEKKQLKFVVGELEKPYAIDLPVNLMEKHEKCEVVSDKKYCIPSDDTPSKEIPHDQLVYIIELLDIQEGPYSSSTPVDKRLDWVEKKRNFGNFLYTKSRYEQANAAYKKCLQVLDDVKTGEHGKETKDEINSLTLKCYNNSAATFIKLQKWGEAKVACVKAEVIDPTNVKTLFRKSKVLSELGEVERSIATLKKASSLSPDDKAITNELSKQQRRLENQNKAHMGMCKRMLGDFAKKAKEPPVPEKKRFWGNTTAMVGGSVVAAAAAVLLGVYMLHR